MRREDQYDRKCQFRASDRVFPGNGEWFFAAREGDEGPYATRAVAEREMQWFVVEKRYLSSFQAGRAVTDAKRKWGLNVLPMQRFEGMEVVSLDEDEPIMATPQARGLPL
jgi:hypothetical protein